MRLTTIKLRAPYLVFFGDVSEPVNAKTGLGIAHWSADRCAGQFTMPGNELDSGLPELSIDEALCAGVGTVIIGVAPVGGQLQENWMPALLEFARKGVDIASGLHVRLTAIPALVAAAQSGGSRLVDVRVPPAGIGCGSGRRRSGKRLLTMGTDCAVGKKYSALALHRELAARGVKATFRATGQTGIMIAGEGIPVDAVVADFLAGAAEALSPDNDLEHWDIIEGQGSLLHPSYSGVTLGLLHGSQPDALVLCHDASRKSIHDVGGRFPIPPLDEFMALVLSVARISNPECRFAGVSVNTSMLDSAHRAAYLAELGGQFELPVVDPIATGMSPIADFLLQHFS